MGILMIGSQSRLNFKELANDLERAILNQMILEGAAVGCSFIVLCLFLRELV